MYVLYILGVDTRLGKTLDDLTHEINTVSRTFSLTYKFIKYYSQAINAIHRN